MELLTPTETSSGCPYKGRARYWDVSGGGAPRRPLAWSYRTPLSASPAIARMVCFDNERVDREIDGVVAERPHTKFS